MLRSFRKFSTGSGNDTLIAGADRSILIGGGGADQLLGGSGEDILIAGTTDYTQPLNAAAFDAILQEWNRTDLGFDDRMSDLKTGSNSLGVAAKNVVGGMPILLNSMTVHNGA
jgi:Ca2+-binding RTX toxin-like protein